jgi:hypothetical protein
LEDAAADQLGDLGDNGVTEGGNSVHPIGKPISHSTNSGLDGPPSTSGRLSPVLLLALRRRLASSVNPPRAPSLARGVGHREQPRSCVWGTNGASGDEVRTRSVAQAIEVMSNKVEAAPSQATHILDEHPFGTMGGDDGGHLWPEPPFIGLSEPKARVRDGLAGKSSGDEVGSG